ncbi:ubiquinone-dependent pyruvate dehydrogenase [Bordetella avium]|uniref:Pyruvate dehydrogenase [ubiquinone] n=1 Tax=Bordetella avium (strain 197N) TaxID=360910 RepID=Q2KX15_BORA1|nr:ubiquinone-dependent pyruvate dehydrogenase [Bordetella avium]RIQ48930.1 ubiquinone-dependent pyruvate dehydrogenase [Bordetella avium]RIQ74835.1 ubiquinone-dependent pyruvate dehydrogenase [Bordetella avium]CAJ48341.1 pyruvate dehydrogenase [cytochrome] [Bordetella avium 197N]
MTIKNVADLVIETLIESGVKRIYGVVGDSLNGLTESVRERPAIEWVGLRHEEVAAFAACGESQVTGELAVCAGSCGPGNLHLINGLFDAHRTRTPVLAIAAHIPSSEIGGAYFQETHPQELFRECSHYCELISDIGQLPYVLDNAIRAAVGQRGVAVIVLPGDVALRASPVKAVTPRRGLLPPQPRITPAPAEIDELADLLNSAQRITLFAGRGCAGSHTQLMQLADALKSPIVHALGGKEHVEYDNPFDVGMTGFIGFSSGYAAMHDCDLLLMLGTDFPYKQFLPEKIKIAQIDIRPEHLGRRAQLTLGVVGDIGLTLDALLPKLAARQNRQFLDRALAHYARSREGLDELAQGKPGGPIHPQYLARLLSDKIDDDAIVTADVGTCIVWSARYLKMNGQRRLIGSLAHGSMANAMPQAIGIQYAQPGRQVVTFSGDGGFSMLMGDLISLKQHNIPIKVVVFNNGVLGFVALEMKAAGFVNIGVDLDNPDFAAVARAVGIHGVRVEDPAALPAAIDEVLAHDGPALLDVVTAKQELVLPPTIGLEQVKGFSLWGLRAVMDGRMHDVIDLARVNLSGR